MGSNETLEKVLAATRCVECLRGRMVPDGAGHKCSECGRGYGCADGIPDFRPSSGVRLPAIYNDENYRKWETSSFEGYLEKSNSIINEVIDSGHKVISKWRRNNKYGLTLDLSCGTGAHFPFLRPEQGPYFGLDIDQKSLRRALEKRPGTVLVRGDAYNLPLEDKSLDCVISVYNLEHLVYLDLALEEMARVVKPDGDVFVSVPNIGGLLWELGARLTSWRTLSSDNLDYRRVVQIEHINSIWQMEKAFKRYFKIERRLLFPFRIPCFHANATASYQLRSLGNINYGR